VKNKVYIIGSIPNGIAKKMQHYFEVIWYAMPLFALYETEPINNRLIPFCAIETQTKKP
jgi:hypothetical protein